jgi:hypothetical protein
MDGPLNRREHATRKQIEDADEERVNAKSDQMSYTFNGRRLIGDFASTQRKTLLLLNLILVIPPHALLRLDSALRVNASPPVNMRQGSQGLVPPSPVMPRAASCPRFGRSL